MKKFPNIIPVFPLSGVIFFPNTNITLNIFEDVSQRIKSNRNIQCVLVDEAQFLTKEHVHQLGQVVDHCHLPVLAYGIRTDFQGEAFPGSQYLLAWADELIELKTICHCGSKATMILRLNADGQVIREGEQVVVGGNESYVSTCRKHFYAGEAVSVNQVSLSSQALTE